MTSLSTITTTLLVLPKLWLIWEDLFDLTLLINSSRIQKSVLAQAQAINRAVVLFLVSYPPIEGFAQRKFYTKCLAATEIYRLQYQGGSDNEQFVEQSM